MGLFTIPVCFLIFRKRPENVLPWGIKSWEELEEQESSTSAGKYGFPATRSFRTLVFWLILIGIVVISFHGSFTQNEPGAAAQWLTAANSPDAANAAMIGAFMMSCGAIGNLLSKLGVGFIIDKWGAGIANGLLVFLCALGMGIWVFLPSLPIIFYIGAFFLGMCSPVMTVGVPMLLRQVFGDRTYPQVQSYISAVTTFVGGLSSPLLAAILVSSGGLYNSIYIFGFALWIFGAIIFVITNRYRGKLVWVDEDGNALPKQGETKAA
jgi:MFS family permease